jgi:phosphatidylserine/phosphatidylglycerophosphate/cardiolipin synthase-like enzyme
MHGRYQRFAWMLALIMTLLFIGLLPSHAAPPRSVVVAEIAWMGTVASPAHEWIELYNNTGGAINLGGWTLGAGDGTPSIALSGTIPAGGRFLLERDTDDAVPGVAADQIYAGALNNDGENLVLRDNASTVIDEVNCSVSWFAGHDAGRVPMVRVAASVDGSQAQNWTHNPRCGTATNSAGASRACTLDLTGVGAALDYAVYFDERAATATGVTDAITPLEQALLSLIDDAATSIDAALYGLDRQRIVDALIAASQGGVTVRVVTDDQAAAGDYRSSYQALANAGIPIVTDTDTIKAQHNNFMVFDVGVVWTGSTNLTVTDLTLNADSSLIVTDAVLAGAYAAEFEEMWSGQFGPEKVDNTAHLLDYDGTLVESYFAPTDLPAFEVWNELAAAQGSILVATSSWTDDVLAEQVLSRMAAGIEVCGLWDQAGAADRLSVHTMLAQAGAHVGIESFPGRLQHNFAIIDIEKSDPVVILSSGQWTEDGAYENDGNTLIVHDRELAHAYYAEWQRLWNALGLAGTCNPYRGYMPAMWRAWPPTPTPTPTSPPAPTATFTPRPPTSTPSASAFGYGIQAHASVDTPRVANAVRDLGLGWLKQQARWEYIEGSKGHYNWSEMDRIADACNAAGIKVMFSVVAAPAWSRPGKPGVGPPNNYQDFYDFMGAMAAHFRGRVHAYEIWNEQNLKREWDGVPLSASDYVRLLKGAYQAIKAADPGAIVVSGAPTPTGINDGVVAIDDRTYLRQMYDAGLRSYCNAVGAHPSGYANPPDVYYTGGDYDPRRGYDDHPSFFFRNTMEDYYQIMASKGDGGKRIWATEFGWPTVDGMGVSPNPGYEFAADINQSQQADYIVRAYKWSRNWGHAGVMFLWNLNLWPVAGAGNEMAKYSIVRGDWSPRPAYTALRNMPK